MSVVVLILSLLGWTMLALLALLLIALCIPVALELRLDDSGFAIAIRWFVLRYSVLPGDDKPHRPDPAPPTAPPLTSGVSDSHPNKGWKRSSEQRADRAVKREHARTEEKRPVDWGFVAELIHPALRSVGMILRGLRLRHVTIVTVVRGEDVARIGIRTGETWAAVGLITSYLNARCRRVQYDEVRVIPDFTASCTDNEILACEIVALPVVVVGACMTVLFSALWSLLRARVRTHQQTEKSALAGAI